MRLIYLPTFWTIVIDFIDLVHHSHRCRGHDGYNSREAFQSESLAVQEQEMGGRRGMSIRRFLKLRNGNNISPMELGSSDVWVFRRSN